MEKQENINYSANIGEIVFMHNFKTKEEAIERFNKSTLTKEKLKLADFSEAELPKFIYIEQCVDKSWIARKNKLTYRIDLRKAK